VVGGAEWVDLLQLRVGFLEHLRLDVASGSAQVQLIRAFQGHGIGRYEKFDRECQIFPWLDRFSDQAILRLQAWD
jgi:hypothetical protein